ncbi:MAG TPA: Obg family GTPase CgtA, partial [Solirubrobacteraceae bacterium]|nr:Obg family GTPase CgtA [Solirubrobacteraceae bacterium]
GIDALGAELLRRVPLEAADPLEPELAEHLTFRPAARRGFHVERTAPGSFRVIGEGIDRLIARHDLENDEAMVHVESRLRRIGVIRALEEQGFTAGDEVEIAGVVFELDPE